MKPTRAEWAVLVALWIIAALIALFVMIHFDGDTPEGHAWLNCGA